MIEKQQFLDTLWAYYNEHARSLPWRMTDSDGNFSLYRIAVSELMLQQTQVDRVIPKYEQFLAAFPNPKILAQASVSEVLNQWLGLGYNRRALYLHEWAKKVTLEGLPQSPDILQLSNGFGKNTAAAVFVYTYNQPLVFIETNIRTVFLNHFFNKEQSVTDQAIEGVLAEVLDRTRPREFYWALMDYGTHLKKNQKSEIKRSKHYQRQAPFAGSTRQLRGKILRLLQSRDSMSLAELQQTVADERLESCLTSLEKEGFITIKNMTISLSI